jgi:hypothetical protein
MEPSHLRSVHRLVGQSALSSQESGPQVLADAWSEAESRPPAPFVVGVPRSGTTLLRLMLDSHPQLHVPAETHFIKALAELSAEQPDLRSAFFEVVTGSNRWGDFHLDAAELRRRLAGIEPFSLRDGLRCFYQLSAERAGKARWGDKTPAYLLHLRSIQELLPEARFIHIIRDGRDVAVSVRQLWWKPEAGIDRQAKEWVRKIRKARQDGAHCRYYMELRYEDLVREPETTLAAICDYLELPYDAAMLSYHQSAAEKLAQLQTRDRGSGDRNVTQEERMKIHAQAHKPPTEERIGRWKAELPREEAEQYHRVAGEMLTSLGYDLTA